MSCPYFKPDCPERTLSAGAVACPQCLRPLKTCPACGVRNRAFANFCRACRTKLPAAQGNWLSYKGSPQRLGLNAASPAGADLPGRGSFELQEKELKLRLEDPCRSLLGYDRHLIALSQNGTIEIGDPELPAATLRLKAEGPISCEPCVEDGVLYLGAPGRLTAYSLGALTLTSPRLAPLWQLRLSGTPVQALTVLGNRLYVTIFKPGGRWEVQVIENLERNPPAAGRPLHASSRVSWTAADPGSQQVVFFSQEDDGIHLHSILHNAGRADLTSHPLSRIPRPFAENVPIALLGGKIFGIFSDEEKLCRIDSRTGEFEQSLGNDIKMFSLNQDRQRGWDGDGVQIDTDGVLFLRSGFKDSFTPLERVVKGSPVIVQGRAAVVGLQDGRLRIYDLLRLPRHEVVRLTGDGEPVTALVSFQSYIAAGNVKGVVKVLELRGKAAAA